MRPAAQLALFELPEPEPPSAEEQAAAMPEGLSKLVEEGLPAEAVLQLHRSYRGTLLHVPKKVAEGHPLAVELGIEDARELCRIAGGETLIIPKGRYRREVRDALIRRDLDNKVPMRLICARYDVTERTVWSIGGRG